MLLLITMCRAEATIRIRPAAKAVVAMQATIGEPLVNVDKNACTSMTRAHSFGRVCNWAMTFFVSAHFGMLRVYMKRLDFK
jgi:hypothetical protein